MRVSIANGKCQVSVKCAFIRRTRSCCPSSLSGADNLLSAD
ncbi:hypothetical protein LTSERUB_1224 [Salmonella enterica subsp. enterica serovar Rubislaw str. A4-653]|uniref:Uncharacterized protein n=1 Tax=Salmonella enterica subsp. enterica serovar Rubislaw str. A4-653 TaxID=913081 RepID=G5QFS4_SALRU|nr:hypothetical protein LTSERUB_1224 [Salmonella enterica subsp. enterica serovar Rubislaw str. A4-653]